MLEIKLLNCPRGQKAKIASAKQVATSYTVSVPGGKSNAGTGGKVPAGSLWCPTLLWVNV